MRFRISIPIEICKILLNLSVILVFLFTNLYFDI